VTANPAGKLAEPAGARRIVLPDGMSYATLVLPEQDHIPLEVIRKH
jgi:hypothetical protein